MLTRCPKCETIFKVSKKHISAAKGLVRCGSCKDIFNAKDHVIKSKKNLKSPESKTTTQTQQPIRAEKKSVTKKVTVNQLVDKSESESESFDFLSDGFTSELARDKFNLTHSPSNTKDISQTKTHEQDKTSSIDLDSLFGNNTTDKSKKSKAPDSKKADKKKQENLNLATFSSASPQPHKATVVTPNSTKPENKPGNFISQNVTEIKKAFTSLSKKLTTKVVDKRQTPKSDESSDKKPSKPQHLSPSITETTKSSSASKKNNTAENSTEKPLNIEKEQLSADKNKHATKVTATASKEKTSAPKVKSKPKLQEDAALKLAVQLKKAALEKTKLENAKKAIKNPTEIKSGSKSTAPKAEATKTQPKLQIVANNDSKKSETSEKNQEKTKPEEKTKSAETKPAAAKKEEEPDDNKAIEDDSQIQIHIENGDIPMVLRESLEEYDIPSRSIQMTFVMFISIIALIASFLLQYTVFRSIEVQQKYPDLKPLITRICQTFECAYNGPRDIKKIQLISRDIRVHPNTKGALLISATIMNNANYQQPYPNFSVKLSSLTGKTIARRFFSPSDYLGKLSNTLLLMPPKQPIRVSLEVVDPGKEAINFEFKFLSRQ